MASLSQGRTAAAQCGLFTHKSVPVIFEPPCIFGRSQTTAPGMAEELVNIRIAGEAEGSEGGDSEAFVNITFRIASFQWNRENLL